MKLPNWERAVVPRKKIVDYLLSLVHEDGRPKAVFFTRLGFTTEDWQELAEALIGHAGRHEVENIVSSQYGTRYIIVGEIEAPDGRRPIVKVIWLVDNESDALRLVTAYPAGRR